MGKGKGSHHKWICPIKIGQILVEFRFRRRNYLEILYDYGDYAVPVFFVISGLVFGNVYLSQEKKESLRNFTIKRIARLYPLHILTFLTILILQYLFLIFS